MLSALYAIANPSVRLSVCLGAPNTRGVAKTSNFRPICGYISERVLDRGIVTMEDEYIKSYVLYRIVPLSMTFSDPEPQFQGHSVV